MPRESYIWDSGTFRPKSQVLAERAQAAAAERSPLPAPMVIRDSIGGINGLVHPATGQRYDSKAQFRAETAARGLTEVGTDDFPVKTELSERELRDQVAREIADTYDMLEAGAEVEPVKKAPENTINMEHATVIDG